MNSQNSKVEKQAPRVAVIGAGLAGLTAAYQLVQGGARVTLFEKGHESGGRAKTTVKDGFHMNLGPHALYIGADAYRFLTSIGAVPKGAQPKIGNGLAVQGRKLFDLPFNTNFQLSAPLLEENENGELMQFMQLLSATDLEQLMSVPLDEFLAENIKSEKVQTVIAAFIRLTSYGNNPKKMSAGAALKQFLKGLEGVLYLDNGWSSIVELLMHAIENSVAIKFESNVEAVTARDGGVDIIENGVTDKFDATILCLPPQEVEKLVPGSIQPAAMQQILPSKVACLDVCLKKLPIPDRTFALGIDEPLYFSVHSDAAQLAPNGGALIHAAVYLGPNDSSKEHEKRLCELLDDVQPGWREELVYKRYLPNMIASNGTPSAALNGSNGIESVVLKDAPNIYVSGDYVGKGSLLVDGSVKSALEAVEQVLGPREKLNVPKERLVANV